MSDVERSVSVSRVIPAPAEDVFAVVADPSRHPEIDGSGTVKRLRRSTDERLRMGSRFGMGMRIGIPYVIKNVVVEYEENRLIAWRHVGRHRWRYELEPVEGGTRVTHTFDWSKALSRRWIEAMRYPEKNQRSMEKTLERLEAAVAG